MQLTEELRQLVWSRRNWGEVLLHHAIELRRADADDGIADRAFELAGALEAIVPDRVHAIEMYLLAWKAGKRHPQALSRARYLANELGERLLAARIARLQYKHTSDPEFLLIEGLIWLDTDEPDRAIRPLTLAKRKRPEDEEIERALTSARREWPNPRQEISLLSNSADEAGDSKTASALYLQAARICRMLNVEGYKYTQLVLRSLQHDPRNPSAYSLAEQCLSETHDWQALVAVHRRRADMCGTAEELIEVYRRAGTPLVVRKIHPQLGAQLVGRGIELACANPTAAVPGQAAMIDVLRSELGEGEKQRPLLPVIYALLERELGLDDQIYLAIAGIDIACNQLGNSAEATQLATFLRDLVPEHPLLADFAAATPVAQTPYDTALGDSDAIPLSDDDLLPEDFVLTDDSPEHGGLRAEDAIDLPEGFDLSPDGSAGPRKAPTE